MAEKTMKEDIKWANDLTEASFSKNSQRLTIDISTLRVIYGIHSTHSIHLCHIR